MCRRSDSFVRKDAVRRIVQPLRRQEVGGVTGHADVHNWKENLLTRIQYIRYFVAFRVYKSAETLFHSVVCLSGCLAAYRRSTLLAFLERWENQTFLGTKCTYGDDRSITTILLREGYKCEFAPEAKTETVVPSTFKKFWKQQLRWKKSWIRETYLAAKFMWRKHPVMSIGFYSNALLTLLSFLIVLRVFFLLPAFQGGIPLVYLLGLGLVSFTYLSYCNRHGIYQGWIFPLLWSMLYALVLVWQIPYAFITLRDTRWGTR